MLLLNDVNELRDRFQHKGTEPVSCKRRHRS
jgi:hypothetical protein